MPTLLILFLRYTKRPCWLLTDLLILGNETEGESLTSASFCSKLDQISASPHSVCELDSSVKCSLVRFALLGKRAIIHH